MELLHNKALQELQLKLVRLGSSSRNLTCSTSGKDDIFLVLIFKIFGSIYQ